MNAYKDQFLSAEDQALPTLDVILDSKDTGIRLGANYNDFLKEFEPVYFSIFTF